MMLSQSGHNKGLNVARGAAKGLLCQGVMPNRPCNEGLKPGLGA